MFFVSIQGRGKHHEFQGREVIRGKNFSCPRLYRRRQLSKARRSKKLALLTLEVSAVFLYIIMHSVILPIILTFLKMLELKCLTEDFSS